MKLLLDEHISPRVADALRENGHDVVAVAEARELRGRSDDEVFTFAAAQKRVVVTHNFADFLAIAAEDGRLHPGLVLVPIGFQRRGIGAYVTALEALLAIHPEPDALQGQIVWA